MANKANDMTAWQTEISVIWCAREYSCRFYVG